MLQRGACEADVARVASEAAIAASLVHPNIVATYSHDISGSPNRPRTGGPVATDAPVKGDSNFKFYLIQVRHSAQNIGPYACYQSPGCNQTPAVAVQHACMGAAVAPNHP